MKKLTICLWVINALCCVSIVAQNSVSGLVTDERGVPLAGVNILVDNSERGTTTNNEGNYSILLEPSDSALVFSYVGFEPQVVEIDARSVVNVTLRERLANLDEVVIVGFGTSTQRALTTAVESVDSDVYDGAAKATPLQALQGRMAGVHIIQSTGVTGSAMNVRIRGQTSVNASNQPLYVIDGIITEANTGWHYRGPGTDNLIGLDPNDIASVEVLKDGAATAIYGSRGANGVILITTKQGQFNARPQVELSYQVGISEPTVRPDVISGTEYANAWNRAVDAAGGGSPDMYFENPEAVPNTDWWDILTRTAMFHDAHVSVSGGSQSTNYYLGMGFRNEEDYFITKGMERYSVQAGGNQLIGDDWQAGLKVNISRTNRSRFYEGRFISATPTLGGVSFPPTTVPFDESGDPILLHEGPGYQFNWNPYIELLEISNLDDLSQLRLGLSVQYSPLPGVNLKSEFNPEFSLLEEHSFESDRTRLAKPIGGFGYVGKISELNNLWTNTATWSIPTSGRSELTWLLGNQLQWFNGEEVFGSGFMFSDPRLTDLTSAGTIGNLGSHKVEYKFSGVFTRANFAYADKYYMSSSLRFDGSSRFGANKRWGVFPALSVGWMVSEEPFMDNNILDYLKFSASIGKTGNAEIGNFDSRSLLDFRNSYGSDPASTIPVRLGNNNLTWETTVQYNVSADFAMFRDQFHGKLSWFVKNTDGLLFYVPVPFSNGFTEIAGNTGSVRNSGFEFELGARLRRGTALSIEFGINGAYVRNEITSLPDNDDDGQGDDINPPFPRIYRVGHSLSTFYLVRYEGVDPANGDALFYDVDDNAPTTEYALDNRLIAGRAIPSFTGGCYLDASYKGFILSAIFQSALGFHIYSPKGFLEDGFENGFPAAYNKNRRQLNSWTPDNMDTDIPEARAGEMNGSQSSTRWLEKGDYLRLKHVQLGYRFENIGRNAKILTVYLAGQNLWTMNAGYNIDPEVSIVSPDIPSAAVNASGVSLPRSFSLGIKLQL